VSQRTAALLYWLLHAYLMVPPLGFALVFVYVTVMVSHASIGNLLADLALSALVAAMLVVGLVVLGRWIAKGVRHGRGFQLFLGWMEVVLAVAVAAWQFSEAVPATIAFGAVGVIAAAAGAAALLRGPRLPEESLENE